jgi:hypothetical protein
VREINRLLRLDRGHQRRPGRLASALHDPATVREFGWKLMRGAGLTVCGGRAAAIYAARRSPE